MTTAQYRNRIHSFIAWLIWFRRVFNRDRGSSQPRYRLLKKRPLASSHHLKSHQLQHFPTLVHIYIRAQSNQMHNDWVSCNFQPENQQCQLGSWFAVLVLSLRTCTCVCICVCLWLFMVCLPTWEASNKVLTNTLSDCQHVCVPSGFIFNFSSSFLWWLNRPVHGHYDFLNGS